MMQAGTTTHMLSWMLYLLPTLLVLRRLPMARMTSKFGQQIWLNISSGRTVGRHGIRCRRSEETSKLVCCMHPILLPHRVAKEISRRVKCSACKLVIDPQEGFFLRIGWHMCGPGSAGPRGLILWLRSSLQIKLLPPISWKKCLSAIHG